MEPALRGESGEVNRTARRTLPPSPIAVENPSAS